MRTSGGLVGFKFIKYEPWENIDKEKIEQEFIDMMLNFTYIPLEARKELLEKLYNKIDIGSKENLVQDK